MIPCLGGAAVRFATVAFKFHTAICVAPFRCSPGDVVVVADSVSRHVNIGVVRSIRSEKPDVPVFLELTRHARDFDRSQKNAAMTKEPAMLATADSVVAANFPFANIQFRDVELHLDEVCATLLVDVCDDSSAALLGPVHALLEQCFSCQVILRPNFAPKLASVDFAAPPSPISLAYPPLASPPESPSPVL